MDLNPKVRSTHEYIHEFLTSPHPNRKGAVCPFVQELLDTNLIKIILIEYKKGLKIQNTIADAVSVFLGHQSNGALVLRIQGICCLNELKSLVRQIRKSVGRFGWMIGAFGPGEDTPSLHNPQFFPFQAPENIVVVRAMVAHDFKFISRARFLERVALYQGYVYRFGTSHTNDRNVIAARRYLARPIVRFAALW